MTQRNLLRLILLLVIAVGVHAQSSAQRPAPLEKTHWKLTWLSGAKVDPDAVRPPYLEFDPQTHRMSGSGGCNRLMGGYDLEGDQLRLTQTARTMMACLHGGETEDAFVKALDQVREWQVSGTTLRLLDADRHVVARFVAAQSQ
jgi:putative lipoprotein